MLLCVARIDCRKNREILLELTAREPEIQPVLIGPVTSAWYAERLRLRAARLKVTERVTLIPGVPPGDPRLKAMLHEPFGIAGAETQAHGFPVIAFDAGGVREWLADGETEYAVPALDVRALAAKLELLARDPALARRLGAAGRERMRERFSPERFLAAMNLLPKDTAS